MFNKNINTYSISVEVEFFHETIEDIFFGGLNLELNNNNNN